MKGYMDPRCPPFPYFPPFLYSVVGFGVIAFSLQMHGKHLKEFFFTSFMSIEVQMPNKTMCLG